MQRMIGADYREQEVPLVSRKLMYLDNISSQIRLLVNSYGYLFNGPTSVANMTDVKIVTYNLSQLKDMDPQIFDLQLCIFCGRRRAQSSQTVCTSCAGARRRRKKQSRSFAVRTGSSPRLTAWAFMTMRLCRACRKISVRQTDGTMPLPPVVSEERHCLVVQRRL